MDVTPPKHHDPAAGDDELAKVLAGVSEDPNEQPMTSGVSGLQFEETPAPGMNAAAPTPQAPTMPAMSVSEPVAASAIDPAASMPTTPISTLPTNNAPSALDDIKRSALEELRPLVDKLNLPPEEKFDTLLLIIRSTDDQSLLVPAHEAAKSITDESKRAQALLDVIKEIDYFSSAQQQQ